MTDQGTIKIPRDDFEEHNARRKEMGLTWAEYIAGEAPERVDYADVKAACREVLREELVAPIREANAGGGALSGGDGATDNETRTGGAGMATPTSDRMNVAHADDGSDDFDADTCPECGGALDDSLGGKACAECGWSE